jgi:hypothetical protein
MGRCDLPSPYAPVSNAKTALSIAAYAKSEVIVASIFS